MQALTNEQWGFDTNCFVCEPRNDAGLRIPFFHDDVNDTVTASFELDGRFSGAPSYLHGGVLLAILDEAMAWAAIAVARRWAVTGETTTRFEHPVRTGRTYTVTATITEPPSDGSASLTATATITDHKDRPCATATAAFVVLGEAQALDALGVTAELTEHDYLRPQ